MEKTNSNRCHVVYKRQLNRVVVYANIGGRNESYLSRIKASGKWTVIDVTTSVREF